MKRPYMNHGISQIEELFEQSKTLPQVLNLIADELKHRKTPRALALDEKVSPLLKGVTLPQAELKLGEQELAPTEQTKIEPEIPVFVSGAQRLSVPPALISVSSKAVLQPPAPSREFVPPRQAEKVSSAEPLISLMEALNILGVKLETSWDVVELARRKIVNLSSPIFTRNLLPEEREVTLQEALKANDAFRSLVRHRAY